LGLWIYFNHASTTISGGQDTPTTNLAVGSTISAAQSWNHFGDNETVRFRVGYTATDSKGDEFLDQQGYTNGFVAVVFENELISFPSDPIRSYAGKAIDVSGTVTEYRGHPQIIVLSSAFITVSK
jgi:DNA/RNA endonuclease YhcR with UshA esterase domain